MDELERRGILYILGARMRKVREVKLDGLSRSGRYHDVYPESRSSKGTVPLKVKQVVIDGRDQGVTTKQVFCIPERFDFDKVILFVADVLNLERNICSGIGRFANGSDNLASFVKYR